MVQKCKPLPQHVERYTVIVEDLQQRQMHAKTQDKQTGKRSLQQDSESVVVGEEIGNARKMVRGSGPFKSTRTREEVNMQWARVAVSGGLPMNFFDNKEVRKDVLFTPECGNNYIGTKPGGVKETTLSHHTYFTTNLIPTLDKLIDDQNMGKMRAMSHELTAAVFSDGWTVVDHHPIVNVIMGVRSVHTLCASIDTMGQEKTMEFITDLILQHIKEIGEGRVFTHP